MERIRVFVIDDHPIIREAFRALLENLPDIEFAGESDGTGDVSAEVEAAGADLALVDYRLPSVSGDALVRVLKSDLPELRVLGMSFDGEQSRAMMLAAGADGFLEKGNLRSTLALIRALATRDRSRAADPPQAPASLADMNSGNSPPEGDLTRDGATV